MPWPAGTVLSAYGITVTMAQIVIMAYECGLVVPGQANVLGAGT
jgi:hypothetical protein